MKILVVDADMEARKYVVSLIQDSECELMQVLHGGQALEIVKESADTIQEVFSALFLPDMDGYQLCHSLRKICPENPIPITLYCTGVGGDAQTFAHALGAVYWDLSSPGEPPFDPNLKVDALHHTQVHQPLTDDQFHSQHTQVLTRLSAAALSLTASLQEDLSFSRERYNTLFEGNHNAVFLLNEDGKCIDTNQKACDLLGYSKNEIETVYFKDLLIPSDVPDFSHKMNRMLSGENPLTFERKIQSRKGDGISMEIIASPVHEKTGRVTGIQLVCQDMTERKKVEAELTYRLIIERAISHASRLLVSPGAIQYEKILEVLCKVFAGSRAYIVKLGAPPSLIETVYSWSDHFGKEPHALFQEGTDLSLLPWWFNILKAGENIMVQTWQDLPGEAHAERTLLQSEAVYSVMAVPILSVDRGLMGFFGIDDMNQSHRWDSEDAQALRIIADMIANYWERRQVQKALQEREEQYRNLFENTPIGIYRTTPDGEILLVNPALVSMMGYSTAEELKRRNLEEEGFEPQYPRNQFKEQLEREGEIIGLESAWIRNDGTTLHVRENARIVRDPTGTICYYEGTVEDITERKMAEKRLTESEERYRNIFNLVPDGIVTTDIKGVITSCNTAFLQLTGFSRGEIVGHHFSRLPTIRMKDLPRMLKFFGSIVRRGKTEPVKFHWLHRDGAVRKAEVHASIMKRNGVPTGILGIARDITEQEQTQEMLKESEEKYRSLMENLGVGVYRVTPGREGQFIDVNQAFVKMLGYTSKEEVLALRVSDIYVDPGDRMIFDEKISSQGFLRNEELHLKRKNGASIIVSDSGTTVYDRRGRVLYYDGISEDITERKRIEEELQQYRLNLEDLVKERTVALENTNKQLQTEISERKLAEEFLAAEKEQLSVTLRSIGDGVITTDTEGQIVLINKVAETLTGWTMEEAVGNPLHTVFHIINEKTRLPCENPVSKVLTGGTIVGLGNDTVLISRDGTERIIADSGAPIRDLNSKIIGVVLVFRDITEKQKMEQELLKAQKLESLGILAGGIAHDFNNILTAILTNVTLAKAYTADERTVQKLSTVEKAIQQAKDLTQQLLTFSRGGAPIRKTTTIGDLIKDTAGFALRGSNVRCRFSIPRNLWSVDIDEGQISQVINNLIINADQAMPEGGILDIHAENIRITGPRQAPLPPGAYIAISIKDQGVGIPEQHIDKVFDPYFTTKHKGIGLGLATTYSIIKHHNGHISVESPPGEGATFTIWLPASGGEQSVEKETPLVPLKGKGNLLVMDDEDIILEAAGDVLEYLGYSVVCARNGKEALAAYALAMEEGNPFDAVIMDLTIPGGLGGKETIQKLIDIDPDVVAIVSSGYSNDPVMANFREYGFKGVVTKPYTIEELSKVLYTVLSDG